MSYEQYLQTLWEGLEGRAVIGLLDSKGDLSIIRSFVWPDQQEELFAHIERNKDKDVYTTDALYKSSSARKATAKCANYVMADADTFNILDALVEPSLIVHTSPGKTHLHWRITDTTDPAIIESLSHSVSDTHPKGTTGMDNGWAINKMLRVPGTTNNKYAEPFTVTVAYTGAEYTEGEFSHAYPPVEASSLLAKEMGTLPTKGDALRSLKASPQLLELLNKTSPGNVDRSDGLHLLQNELFRSGASDEAVFVICRDHPFNKFADKRDADAKLWEDIMRGRSKSEVGVPEEAEAFEVTVTVEPAKQAKEVDFLSPEEKANMESTFIDDYVAWATSKTDAAQEYHVASAFMILSTVFSDFGHAVPKFGRLPLNLWFMVLGETTRSRKSTTRALGLSFIKALSDEDKWLYDLGSDATPEALDNELLKRPHRSALLHRDEAQGWIQEMDKKAYMAGAKQKMTELYDGHVSGKLRATGDQNRRASVDISLTLFMMGIASQMAEYLTQEDFRSGFLTRFIYIQATPPPRSRESDWLEQADINEVKQGDPVFQELVQRIETAREHWDDFTPCDAPTTPVPCTREAWLRLNMFITDVLDAAEGHERHAIIEAASDRLSKSILKAATLLAMLDCCDEVQVSHMIAAINYAASWFGHMVNMANSIAESHWARGQKKVMEFLVEHGGIAKWEQVYRKFRSELDPGNFLKIIQALQDSGMVDCATDEKKQRWIEALDMDKEIAA